MPQDVLIVEDDIGLLNSYKMDIEKNLHFEPFVTTDPEEALFIVQNNVIKVLVTDYFLPKMTGLDLVKKVKNDLNSDIRCILITAFSHKISSKTAGDAGLNAFIEKLEGREKLEGVIREQIDSFNHLESLKNLIPINKDITVKKPFFQLPKFSKVTITFVRISSINKHYYDDNDWAPYHLEQKGVTSSKETTIHHTIKSSNEWIHKHVESSKFDISLENLISAVNIHAGDRIEEIDKRKIEEKFEIKSTIQETYVPINDEKNDDGLTLLSREFQSAPLYTRINCVLEIHCNCCGVRPFILPLNIPRNQLIIRQIERYDDGTENIKITGTKDANVQFISPSR